jgi:hypothetical protein
MPALKFLNAPINLLVEQDREDIDIHYLEHGGKVSLAPSSTHGLHGGRYRNDPGAQKIRGGLHHG